ncbi:MAG: cell division protein ZapA [Oscillospiraceae bacterium]|nr:cell division protein ZapA [Candidatus Ruminococcus equi]
MEKNKVSVLVAGQRFTLVTEESDKNVMDIAASVDAKINTFMARMNMSREKCSVLAALDFCDDERKARKAINEIKDQIKDYITEISTLKEENEKLKKEIEKLNDEKQRLIDSKKATVITSKEALTESVTSQDDLSFDFPNEIKVEVDEKPTQEAEKKVDNTPSYFGAPIKKPRHEHKHENPYKQQFEKKQSEQKGYTPQRQYTLFDNDNE